MKNYISRQYTVPLNMIDKNSREESNNVLARSVQASRDIAFSHVDRRIRQLEKASDKRAVDKLYIEKFSLSKGLPALTVRVEFLLVTK